MSEEVLTDEESEALLDQSAPADEPTSAVHDPDDEFWEQVAPGLNPELDAIGEAIADAAGRVWMDMFAREIVVSSQTSRVVTGRNLARSIDFEECVRSFDIQNRGEQALLIVRPDMVSAMVDLCFGGPGNGTRSERLAGLTEMERRMFARFCDQMRERVTEIWSKRGGIAFQNANEEFSAGSHALCGSGARAVISRFAFDIAEREHAFEFVWPAALSELLRERKPQALPAAQQRPELDWEARLRDELRGARLEVRAVIDGIPLRLHQISRAKTGDIIFTEPLEKVGLFAGDQRVFEGTLGVHNGLNAVKISQPFIQRRSGDA